MAKEKCHTANIMEQIIRRRWRRRRRRRRICRESKNKIVFVFGVRSIRLAAFKQQAQTSTHTNTSVAGTQRPVMLIGCTHAHRHRHRTHNKLIREIILFWCRLFAKERKTYFSVGWIAFGSHSLCGHTAYSIHHISVAWNHRAKEKNMGDGVCVRVCMCVVRSFVVDEQI